MSESGVSIDDLIVAVATPEGRGAIAILRLDGEGVERVVETMFRPAKGGGSPLTQPRRMIFGAWVEPGSGEVIDHGLTVYFGGARSYTGNALAEFQCHGGAVPSRRLLETALGLGARPAAPGEFTRRAFLNGRMDLAQAEAVADLINAQTDEAARSARAQLSGGLSDRVRELHDKLVMLAAEIEARIDFPEEDLDPADAARLGAIFAQSLEGLGGLLDTRRRGRLLRQGARVVLVGRPNAGKSSLLNALTRRERAIVTPHPGTTRDTIECMIDLGGVPLTLIDTAGLRASGDPIEQMGIQRTREAIEGADLVVHLIDASDPGIEDEAVVAALALRPADLAVWNKCDLTGGIEEPGGTGSAESATLRISALTGLGLARLETTLIERLLGEPAKESEAFAVNARQSRELETAVGKLSQAERGYREGESPELVMIDLRDALHALGDVVGLETDEAILDKIFSSFCLGK